MTTPIRLLSLCCGLGLLGVLAILPFTNQYRFANLLRPYAAGIFSASGPIDVIFVGTSRTRSSIMAHELDRILSATLNRKVVIYDLGKSARGTDADYLFLKEVLHKSSVKLVIAEYTPASQYSNHFFFSQAASMSDILQNAMLLDRPMYRISSVAREKLQTFMTEFMGGREFAAASSESEFGSFDFTTPRGPNQNRLAKALSTGRNPIPSLNLEDSSNIVQDTYLRQIVKMVREQGGDVALAVIPGLDQKALDSDAGRQLADHYDVDVVSLTDEQLLNFNPHFYADEKHHGWMAVDPYMKIVADWIIPRLATQPARKTSE